MGTQGDAGTPEAPDGGTSPLARALTGVVVGVVGLGLVGLIVVVLAYHLMVEVWAQPRDASANGSPSAIEEPVTSEEPGAEEPGTATSDPVHLTPEGLDGSNEAYRQRLGSAEGDALAAESLADVRAVLDDLAASGPVERDDAVAALRSAGFDAVQVTPEVSPLGTRSSGFGIGVSVPGGCVFGEVDAGAVTLEAGGPIADGGCLAMPGH